MTGAVTPAIAAIEMIIGAAATSGVGVGVVGTGIAVVTVTELADAGEGPAAL